MKFKSIAIMQPYVFPYIGYWQLINTVDTFVVYDDVNFIKKGWIHRNTILLDNKSKLFTIPLSKASQNKKINEIYLFEFEKWKVIFLNQLSFHYKTAPFYKNVKEILENIFSVLSQENNSIVDLFMSQLKNINTYLDIDTTICSSSEKYNNSNLKGQERIIDICKVENAKKYINPLGGIDLYNANDFSEKNIELCFLKSELTKYKQFNNEFVPWLSIIDVLMFNSKEQVKDSLNMFKLI